MLERLIAIQKREGLSDTEMGARLKVGRSRWAALRLGLQPWSDKMTLRAAGAWPELTGELLEAAKRAAAPLTERTTAT